MTEGDIVRLSPRIQPYCVLTFVIRVARTNSMQGFVIKLYLQEIHITITEQGGKAKDLTTKAGFTTSILRSFHSEPLGRYFLTTTAHT